ncbi:hypothetical protein K435DRAFT_709169 [Dendrothele bispora CBS 962.96]|uniref:Uncharacterized protein n=1 Tax=Dendrothele bispora (strain CBS 962.96) TaxID=1314807 RepID=A0A4S8MXW5_DENBC|nr:hypothetical protein K435DRAFT_709169 [Dendrothele bispora CBS 962.96]
MSKTLSTGTLSLRFMQNAQRAKQLKEVELEKAHVEDDGQWEIAQEIRDSWGPVSQPDNSISHETSYIPFLFPSFSDPTSEPVTSTPDSKPKGRRAFEKGREVISQTVDAKPDASTSESTSTQVNATQTKKGKKVAKSSILSSDSGDRIAHSVKSERPISKSNKIARLAIFDTSGVGTDLRPSSAVTSIPSDAASRTSFIKPAGIDDPRAVPEQQVISGAREKKTKRARNTTSGPGSNEDFKPKKRKTASE